MRYPYPRKKEARRKLPRIEVGSDSMRVGKTTAVRVIAEGLRNLGYQVHDSYEDWQNNPYLKGSYSDPEKNFLDSQKWFIRRKWEQIAEGDEGSLFLQDVYPEMDYCYAATNMRIGRMSREHFREYEEYYYRLDWSKAPAPDLIVYLQVSDNELIKRTMASRREFENVDEEYFLTMKRVNREWLSGVSDQYRILQVDTDKIDFANDEMGKENLIQKVVESISF